MNIACNVEYTYIVVMINKYKSFVFTCFVVVAGVLVACSSDAASSLDNDSTEAIFSSSGSHDAECSSSVNNTQESHYSFSDENSLSSALTESSSSIKEASSSSMKISSSSKGPESKEEYYSLYDDEELNILVCGKQAFEIKGSRCFRNYSKCVVSKTGDGYKRCASWTGEGCPAGTFHSSGCVNSTCTKWQTVYSYDSSFVNSNQFCDYTVLPDYTTGMKCSQSEGFIKNEVSKQYYVCDSDSLRLPTELETTLEFTCTSYNRTEIVEKNNEQYECKKNGWVLSLPVDSFTDDRDGTVYRTVKVNGQVWMYDNLIFERDSSWCSSQSDCEKNGRLYTWSAAMNLSKECNTKFCNSFLDQGICPDGWVVPDTVQLNSLYNFAKKNDVFDQLNVPAIYGNIIQLWTRNFSTSSITKAWQMYNQENTTMKMSMIAEPKSKGVYVKCVQGTLDIEQNPYDYETMLDERDGHEYRIISIGEQTWMAENLNYDAGESQSWCYQFTESYCNKFGRLYTWDAVMGNLPTNQNGYVTKEYIEQQHQGICPENWHVPSDSEWIALRDFVGNVGKNLKSNFGWKNDGNGIDFYHFRALPAGYTGNIENYSSYDQTSSGIGLVTYFHTTKQTAVNAVYVGALTNSYTSVGSNQIPKYAGASLRCVLNKEETSE